MALRGGADLLEHGLRDIYDAEHRFVDALETMIGQVSDPELVDGFRRHQLVTKEQIRRLERAFDEIGKEAKREDCPGSKGLIAEYQKFVKDSKPDPATLDTFAAEAGLKVEHYEIASYRSLMNLAQFLGYDGCLKLFRQTLAEEEQAAAELQSDGARLAADLTGAGGTGLARRAGGTLFDQMREGALVTAETAKTVGERATKRAGKAIRTAEKRGRKAVRSAQARGRASKAKATRSSTTRKSSTSRKTSRPARKASPRKTTERRTTRPTTRKTATSRTRTRARSGSR